MENEKPNTLLKSIVLAAFWLTLSPLLLILDGRWKLLPKWLRIVLSPMMLVVMAKSIQLQCHLGQRNRSPQRRIRQGRYQLFH